MNALATAPILLLAACAACAQAIRFSEPPVSLSVRNESNAAIDRACAWIASLQRDNGSWDDDPELTSIALLALAGYGDTATGQGGDGVSRAIDWLAGATATNVSAAAWRDTALAVLAPDRLAAASDDGATPPPAPIPYSSAGDLQTACAIRERAAILGIDDLADAKASSFTNDLVFASMCERGAKDSPEKSLLAEPLACHKTLMSFAEPPPERAWRFIHTVNIVFGGNIPGHGWRGQTTSRYTTSQTITAKGLGHWNGSLRDTAFAVMLLNEL